MMLAKCDDVISSVQKGITPSVWRAALNHIEEIVIEKENVKIGDGHFYAMASVFLCNKLCVWQ